MRRRLLAWPILCFLMMVEACTGDQHAMPTEVTPNLDAAASAAPAACPTPAAVDKMIIALAPPGKKIIAAIDFDLIVLAYKLGQVKPAQQAMLQLWAKVLKAYFANQLTGGMGSGAQNAVIALGQAFYCNVGLDGSGLTVAALGGGSAIAVLFPSTTPQMVVTGDGNGGVLVPSTALVNPVTITITPIPGTFPEFTGPLHTPLDQFGPFFQYTVSPAGAFADFVTVAVCTQDPQVPLSRVHLAHDVTTGANTAAQILPLVTSFLNTCTANAMMRSARSPFELAQAQDYRGALSAVGSMIGNMFVTDAFAGGGSGIGGKTKTFSPFGLVDTLVQIVANPPTNQNAPTGSPLASPPSVTVQTFGEHTPLPGVGVEFSITTGAGVLVPASGTSIATGANGIASTTSWSVGVGQNIVTAVGTYPTPGVSISRDPTNAALDTVADSAFGGDVIPYLSPNYRYLLASPLIPTMPADTAGFFNPGFNDAAFTTGGAAFGSGSVPGQACPLDNTVVTKWNNIVGGGSDTTGMLLRKTFPWPAAGTGSTTLLIGVAIDNDVQVYVNGTDVTSSVQGGSLSPDGFVHHEGCAADDSFIFSFSDALLVAGNNLLAVRARDRGVVAYVDARVSVQTQVIEDRITKPIRAGQPKSGALTKPLVPSMTAPRLRLTP
jgi:hypothetical protein